jgi:hypothetical protein
MRDEIYQYETKREPPSPGQLVHELDRQISEALRLAREAGVAESTLDGIVFELIRRLNECKEKMQAGASQPPA